jgi:hypothetical protein
MTYREILRMDYTRRDAVIMALDTARLTITGTNSQFATDSIGFKPTASASPVACCVAGRRFVVNDQLSKYLRHNMSVHIGKSIVASLESERQPFVVETQKVHDRRLKIMYVDFIFDNTKT